MRYRSGAAPSPRRGIDLLRGDVAAASPPVAPQTPAEPQRELRRARRGEARAAPRDEPRPEPRAEVRPATRRVGDTVRVAKSGRPHTSKALLLVLLLVSGGLAGVLVPDFFRAQRQLRRAALATDLRMMNEAAKQFREQHNGRIPGIDDDSNVDEERLVRQLTLPTDARGQVLPGGPFGPYLKAGLPPNPWNASNGVRIVSTATLPAADGTTGWIFHVPTGQFVSNSRNGGE